MTTPLISHATARAELLPCPFCGSGDIRIYLNAPSSDTRPWNHVTCLSCGTGHSSVARWNSRADSAEITALRGRVERLEGAGWQPIATAPKNMLPRLYLCTGKVIQGFVDACGILTVQHELGWRAMRRKPTHWMPLPAPPRATLQDQEGGDGK